MLKNLNGTSYQDALGLCVVHIGDKELFKKFNRNLPLRTIIINENIDWSNIQTKMVLAKLNNDYSTGHFLTTFIHEFMHSAHLDNLMKIFNKDCEYIFSKLQKKYKNLNTICMLNKETSKYGATYPSETVAEEFTELIVNSLNHKTLLPNEMIFKMQWLKEPFLMNKFIRACWDGDVKQVEKFRKDKSNFLSFLNPFN